MADNTETWLAHNVYFTLHDNSVATRQRLVDACHKYLSGHPGTLFFAAGVLAPGLERPVNDRGFDVALHVVFDSRTAHDDVTQAKGVVADGDVDCNVDGGCQCRGAEGCACACRDCPCRDREAALRLEAGQGDAA